MQTNDVTERFNQTLSQCLAKVCNEDQTNWDEKLDTVLMGYRASRQASTKHSPYYMLFQQHMRLPIDAEILPPSDAPDENAPDVNTAVRALMKSREKVFKKAESNILSAQKKQKETYDRKHQPAEIPVGTGPTGKYCSKAEEGWQTITCMAWSICCPPLHWKWAL